jgi:hypothetical protein
MVWIDRMLLLADIMAVPASAIAVWRLARRWGRFRRAYAMVVCTYLLFALGMTRALGYSISAYVLFLSSWALRRLLPTGIQAALDRLGHETVQGLLAAGIILLAVPVLGMCVIQPVMSRWHGPRQAP